MVDSDTQRVTESNELKILRVKVTMSSDKELKQDFHAGNNHIMMKNKQINK